MERTDDQDHNQKLNTVETLLRYVRPHAGKATAMAVLLLASIGLQLLMPMLLGRFIDAATAGASGTDLRNLALLFLLVALSQQLLSAGATYFGADVGWSATNRVRRDLASHVLNLDMSFHTSRTPGEMIERIDGDVTSLSNFFSQFSVRVLGGVLLLIGILAVLWVENVWLGLAFTLFTALEVAVLGRTRKSGVPATELEREANARLFGFIEERRGGIDEVRANGAGEHAMYRFHTVAGDYFRGSLRAWLMRSVVWVSSYGLFILGSLLMLASVVFLVTTGRMTLGVGYMVFQYLLMLQTPIDQITQQMQELQRAVASIGRVRELLSHEPTPPPRDPLRLPRGPLEVEFRDVTFSYEEDAAPQLDGVSFRLPAGSVLGLLGRTGSGKTTITRLLFDLYRPQSGEILLAGTPLKRVDPDSRGAAVGLVTQDVRLFGATVRDNLTFFDRSRSDAELVALLGRVGLGPWLGSLPEGLDSEITAGAGNLSAGQAQMLAFARVHLRSPGLVILDEPTSRLDPATEAALERSVDELLRGRTGIIVAHRLKTVERADFILVMDGGRVAEFGARADLARNPTSRYSQMLRTGLAPDEDVADDSEPAALAAGGNQ